MLLNGKHTRSIRTKNNSDGSFAAIIFDQRYMPYEIVEIEINSSDKAYFAIKEMQTRGAPLIGAVGAYGTALIIYEAYKENKDFNFIKEKAKYLISSRPTAVNLEWAVNRVLGCIGNETSLEVAYKKALQEAENISDEDAEMCRQIGVYGFELIKEISQKKGGETVNILTHCNAGWLATVDYGTATAPIYEAQKQGIDMHVWVDETRPRNQGAKLTAFELTEQGIKNTLIADNTGGHLMQHGLVDMVIVGSDRVSRNGDVANKIGTYLKALAAFDNNIPFYATMPSSTIDFNIFDGLKEIPIEIRDESEVLKMDGLTDKNRVEEVLITHPKVKGLNYGFDVTPARLVTGLITERGIISANITSIEKAFEDKI